MSRFGKKNKTVKIAFYVIVFRKKKYLKRPKSNEVTFREHLNDIDDLFS